MHNNPYTDSLAVKVPTMFFGRKELLISLCVASHQGRCISLKGTRHIGKSSVMKYIQSQELQQELEMAKELSREIFVYVSMRDYTNYQSEENFFRDVYENIVKNASYKDAQQEERGKEERGKEWSELFKLCLEDLQKANYRVVLLMDVFDKVVDEPQFGPQFFSYLRALAEKGLISYIITSILPLHAILINGTNSPFFNIFRTIVIEALDLEDARQLITIPSANVGLPLSTDEVSWIIEQAGRHPFFLQLCCYHLLEEKSKLKNGQSLDFEQLRQKIYKEIAPHFDSIWKDLSQEEQSLLRREIQRTHQANQDGISAHTLEELSESALFRYHMHTVFHIEQAELSQEALKEILEHYQEREFLANSILASMNYVEIKRKGNNSGSHQIGSLVQEFLREAFERMKPAGPRNANADIWRSYNIIYHRYIHEQMRQEYIMPKLGIARRQYYRSQNEAIQELHRHLLDLNSESFSV